MSDDKKKHTMELVKEAAKDMNEQVKEWSDQGVYLPFISTFFAAMGLFFARWEEHKFEEFLNHIRLALAFDNIGQVSTYIAQNIHHRWMAEGLAQGWKLGLETMDDTARKCANNMVADYLAQKKAPDRAWRQLARLFIGSDEGILRTLLSLADILLQFKDSCLVATTTYEVEGSGWDADYAVFPLIGEFVELDFVKEEFSIEAACELAVLANLGVQWSDPTIRDERPGYEILHRICQVDPHHYPVWKMLNYYLKPVLSAAKT